MKKFLFSAGFTVIIAFAIVVVGRVVLMGYETFFEALTRQGRIPDESNELAVELIHITPSPTPHVGEDFVPVFNFEPDNEMMSNDEGLLPEPINITPLELLSSFSRSGSLELPIVGATGWTAAFTGLYIAPPGLHADYDAACIVDDLPYTDENHSDDNEYPESMHGENGTEIYHDNDWFYNDGDDIPDEPLTEDYTPSGRLIRNLPAGQVFVILQEWGGWWHVRLADGEEGWVRHAACFINLPDVIPSIVYNITNSSGSIKISGGFEIPGVTGVPLYNMHVFNHRFGRGMYIVPALYATAKRLFYVQQTALANGDTLVVYEVFRPHATQQLVVNRLNELMRANTYVRAALNTPPWSPTWFISHGVSHHQRGAAVDVSLARVVDYAIAYTADFLYDYRRILNFVMYPMPTAMHDLHPAAATFTAPGSNVFASTMTEGAKLMHGYFTRHGFTPLASEWWHFTDLRGADAARGLYVMGNFFTESILSFPPAFGG